MANLTTAKSDLDKINYLNLGHNSLRVNANIEQMFGMIESILEPIIDTYSNKLSDINIAKYGPETVDSTKVNICWRAMSGSLDKYMILLCPTKNGSYIDITSEIESDLLTIGYSSGWYLLNQIDCLNKIINSDKVDSAFNSLISKSVASIFNKHQTNASISAHYASQFGINITTKADIQQLATNLQSNVSNVQLANARLNYITTANNDTLCTITDYLDIEPVTSTTISYFAKSEYLLNNVQYTAFIENTTKQKTAKNVFCFVAHRKFSDLGINASFDDNNYIVNCQATGNFKLNFDSSISQTIAPVCPPIPIHKTVTDITFFLMLKINTNTFEKVTNVDCTQVGITYSLTGKLSQQIN